MISDTNRGEAMLIAIDLVDLDPGNVRLTAPTPEENASFLVSLKEQGLIQPIVVRPGQDGRFVVVAGARRLQAARDLGWTAIDARRPAEASFIPEPFPAPKKPRTAKKAQVTPAAGADDTLSEAA